jgi:predicted ABC-type exoprotein transport system permease subunit
VLHFSIFLTTISTEYFKHAAHSSFFLQNAVYFIMLPFLVPVLFTFHIQDVLKLKCKTQVLKGSKQEYPNIDNFNINGVSYTRRSNACIFCLNTTYAVFNDVMKGLIILPVNEETTG